MKKIRVKKVDPLNVEIRSFLECVSERKTPRVSGREGKRSLEVALQIAGMIEDLISRYRR
jgi:hypothetical protein